MYDKKNLAFVLTTLEAIEKLWIYTEDVKTGEELLERDDQMIYNASVLLLGVIGEETKKLSEEIKLDYPTLPWQEIVRMRNRIAHDYRGVNPNITYVAITQKLEPLKEVLTKVFHSIDCPQATRDKLLDSPYYRHIQYLKKDHE